MARVEAARQILETQNTLLMQKMDVASRLRLQCVQKLLWDREFRGMGFEEIAAEAEMPAGYPRATQH